MKFTNHCELEMSSNPLDWKIQELEGHILEAGRKAMCEMYLAVLAIFEKKLLNHRGPTLQMKDICTKKLATVFGEVDLKRYRIWDSALKKSRYLLDERLGIDKWQKATVDFTKDVVRQSVQRSYGQSSQEIEKQTGVTLSKMSTWHLVQKESAKQQRKVIPALGWKHLALPRPPELGVIDPCPALGIDLDGTYCRSWKIKKWRKDHEVKVAVLYRHKVRVGKKKWALKDKLVIASGPSERLQDFLQRVTQTAIEYYGLHANTQVVVHGDGDQWIRRYATDYFPNAMYRLDPWHVFKKMREATGLKKLPNTWIQAVYGQPVQLIAELKNFQLQFEEESLDFIKLKDLIGYITNNQDGLKPSGISQETKQQHPRLFKRGSGTIERNIDWVVCERFKKSRMSWSKKGLENLLYLRQNYLNGYKQPTFKAVPAQIRSWKASL